jgi:hypothetical protein
MLKHGVKPRSSSRRQPPAAAPAPDPEARATPAPDLAQQDRAEQVRVIARARRIARCEREVQAALAPILQRHRCRLGTRQEIIDGQPGDVRVVVVPSD